MSHTVNVTGISPSTTETQLHDFFTFCGKIASIDFDANDRKATIHFEKPSAAKTALMLNGGTLDGQTLTVTSDVAHQDEETTDANQAHGPDGPSQEDKPRAGIAAEYLARGYTLSDGILTKAIQIDNERGISKRFLTYFNSIDQTIGAKTLGPDQTVSGKVMSTLQGTTQQARSLDEQKGYSKSATDYYTKALSSPFGQKVRAFYTTSSKQILDIHEEAKRISEAQKAQQGSAPAAGSAPGSASAEIPGGTTDAPKATEAPTIV